jgi:hypothetical protein
MRTVLLPPGVNPITVNKYSIYHIITAYMVWPCPKNGRGTTAQDSIEVDTKAEESTRETEEKLDGRNKEGREREEPV